MSKYVAVTPLNVQVPGTRTVRLIQPGQEVPGTEGWPEHVLRAHENLERIRLVRVVGEGEGAALPPSPPPAVPEIDDDGLSARTCPECGKIFNRPHGRVVHCRRTRHGVDIRRQPEQL
jgi:hypothetical protein